MSSTRSVKSPGIFANDALTTIPPVPVTGVSYRDAVNGTANIEDGWPYGERVNSAEYNQIMYQLSTLLEILDKQGILGWTDQVDYVVPAYVVGSDGRIYQALQASGPATAAQDPISAPTYWRPYLDTGVGNTWRLAVYATPGAISHTVEANTYWKAIEVLGAGGGGGAGGTVAGTGGGAGGWGFKRLAVTPGQVLTGVVGTRGAGGAGIGAAGGNGGSTTFGGVTANGGQGGAGGSTGGGAGGTVTGADYALQGGNGNSAAPTNSAGTIYFGPPGGGAARQAVSVGGYSSTGGGAGAGSGNGGGGGAGGSAIAQGGGNGAHGLVLVWG